MKKVIGVIALLTITLALSFSSAYAVSEDSGGASRDLARIELSPREPCRTCVEKAPGVCNNRFIFDATDSYDPNDLKLSFLWDFGDGTTSTEPVVTHSYAKGGTYNVTLTVTNTSGLKCDTSVSTRTVTVNTPPAAVLIKKALNIEKGSSEPHRMHVGSIKREQLEAIAQIKMPDLNTNEVDAAIEIIGGTARSMGVTVSD